MGELSVKDIFKIAKAAQKTEDANLGKVGHGIKALKRQVEEQKEMTSLLRECSDLNETAEKVLRKPATKRQLEDCDRLEEHALKVLRACKRLKGTDE